MKATERMATEKFTVNPMSDNEAREVRAQANDERKKGTPLNMRVAAVVDEAVSRHTIISEN